MYYARHTKQGGIAAAVAQLVEPWIVIPVVVGSSPISRPNILSYYFLFFITFCNNLSLLPYYSYKNTISFITLFPNK